MPDSFSIALTEDFSGANPEHIPNSASPIVIAQGDNRYESCNIDEPTYDEAECDRLLEEEILIPEKDRPYVEDIDRVAQVNSSPLKLG